MTLPTDRTNKAALDTNLVNGVTSDAPKIKANNDTLYNTTDELYNYVLGLIAGGVLQPYPAFLSRQALINGNFDIPWSRYTVDSYTNPNSGRVTADRWKALVNYDGGVAPANVVHSRQILTPGDIPFSFYFYRASPDGAGSAFGVNAEYGIRQFIEFGARSLCGAGKKITLSFWARSSIPGKKIGVWFFQGYGTGGSPTAGEVINGQSWTLSSTWTKYTVTVSTNTLVGKTFGTNNDDSLAMEFQLAWGGNNAARVGGSGAETLVGAGNIDIAQVQVNAGDQPLPFQQRSFPEELALCMRFGEPIGAGAFGQWTTATQAKLYGSFKVPKRVNPSFTLIGSPPTIEEIGVADRAGSGSTVTDNAGQKNGFTVTVNGFTGATPGNRAASRLDIIFADAEL